MNTHEYLDERKALIDNILESVLPSKKDVPNTLAEGMRYTVLSAGKRIRPILLIAACEAAGGDPEKAMNAACAVELIHAYSLIHDDLPAIDDDHRRRGKPTLHIVIGEGNAVLVGDALQALAFRILAEDEALEPAKRVLLISELARAAGMHGMTGGQVADLASEDRKIDASTLEYIHRHKTGAMIIASVRMGGIVGRADEKSLEALKSYGENAGLAFQIVDDILDVVGNVETLGKATGADEMHSKATYMSILGVDESRRKAGACIENAIAALEIFGERAVALVEIAKYIINRIR